jgi:CBS-domain-containing membrane protein
MLAPPKPLLGLTAADVMSQCVISISQDMSLHEAAKLLDREQISGAPVVDDQGRCVGVLSATDFVHWVEHENDVPAPLPGRDFCSEWQVIDPERLPRDAVHNYMSTDLVTVEPELPIAAVARRMLDVHVHRLVVLDGRRRPAGIVTSSDLLTALAYAIEPD